MDAALVAVGPLWIGFLALNRAAKSPTARIDPMSVIHRSMRLLCKLDASGNGTIGADFCEASPKLPLLSDETLVSQE